MTIYELEEAVKDLKESTNKSDQSSSIVLEEVGKKAEKLKDIADGL